MEANRTLSAWWGWVRAKPNGGGFSVEGSGLGWQWSLFGGSGHSEPPQGHWGHERGCSGEGKQEFYWWVWSVHSQTSLICSPINRVVADTTHGCAVTLLSVLLSQFSPKGLKSIMLYKNWKPSWSVPDFPLLSILFPFHFSLQIIFCCLIWCYTK